MLIQGREGPQEKKHVRPNIEIWGRGGRDLQRGFPESMKLSISGGGQSFHAMWVSSGKILENVSKRVEVCAKGFHEDSCLHH